MNLSHLGWTDFYQSEDLNNIARVSAVYRSHSVALSTEGEINLYLPGHIDHPPSVGDWVEFLPPFVDEQDKPAAIIKQILPRKTVLARAGEHQQKVLAANIDNVFIVTSANQDFNIRRLHRFLVLVKEGGAQPIIILSKIDLNPDYREIIKQIRSELSIETVGTSIETNEGLSELKNLLPQGSTSVFVGSSGVGKSSLVNCLLGKEKQATKGIREDDGKGRHTTTSRELFFVPDGGMIIDTPGIREVQVFGSSESLNEVFPKIEQLIDQCKYNDCQHQSEPDCAIITALELGELSQEEWASYQKLLREMEHVNRKHSKAESANAKKRWKEITVNIKKIKKHKSR